ncbi:MAG: bifunctional acetate--CoA ligase family protein/GNAT family N-acetyltransferase [Actinomycetota bacterium]
MEIFFEPNVVALIGATEKEGSVGASLMKNLLLGKDNRKIYPVNPSREEIMGVKAYPKVADIPDQVDLAVIATPAATVPGVMEECGRAGVKRAIIISAGFREVGEEGSKLEAELNKIRAKYGMRVLGPNCVGLVRPSVNLDATFLRNTPEPGSIAFISQSGALGSAIFDWAVSAGIGFSVFASMGSMIDMDFGDMIDFMGSDAQTRSIIIYMEGIGDGRAARKFMSAARGFARTKPIIIMKPGKTAEGARAARSHTGALAGSYEVYEAAFRRAGVIPVEQIQDLFNCASVLDARHLPAGPRIGLVTNAGGPGVIAADAIKGCGLELAELSPHTMDELNAVLPPQWSRGNPIDVLGDADNARYVAGVKACIADPGVDGVVVIYTPQGGSDPSAVADAVGEIVRSQAKPVLAAWMGGQNVIDARGVFARHNVPSYATPEGAIKTYMYMYRYKRNLELLYETPEEMPVDMEPPRNHLKVLAHNVLQEGRTLLTEAEAGKFLDAYGIPRARGVVCSNLRECARAAGMFGYPLVMKIVSPDISHKTDVGGVVTGITNEAELSEAFSQIMASVEEHAPAAQIVGVYVQQMITKVDYELILGAHKDPDFGAVVLFGAGGVLVELAKDAAIGLPPLNQTLARRLMEETRIHRVLRDGFRNKPPADLRAIEATLARFSNMIVDFPEIAEVDINPLAVGADGLTALDARIILDKEPADAKDPHRHLVVRPYPSRYVTPWKIKDGRPVILRPIRPEDEPLEEALISGLSPESSRFRFFELIRDITHEMLVRYCNIDYEREMAIIAEYTAPDGTRRNVGVGRLVTDPSEEEGEFAVVIADDFASQGLGTKLVDMLIGVSEDKGLKGIYGVVLPDNTRMIDLCRKLGMSVRYEGDEVRVELKH